MSNTPAKEQLWTPANIVTLLRICLIPVFVIVLLSPWPSWMTFWPSAEEWKPFIAAFTFAVLAATDALDGYLARSRGEVTNLGKFMDPLADKILVAAALLALIELSVLPSWVALIILTREFIVSGIRMVAASQGIVIAASMWGKAKTVTQIAAILLFLVKDSHMVGDFSSVASDGLYLFSWVVMLVALALTIVSMLDYFVKAKEILGFTKKIDTSASSVDPDIDQPQQLTDPVVLQQISDVSIHALATSVVEAAVAKDSTLATAESCTGGLICGSLTSVPGSSAVVAGGIVSYSNDVKRGQLGVSEHTLERFGAVSEDTACEMAEGAKKHLSVTAAVSVTGIAGPGGAVDGKPVGTVWVGLSDTNLTVARVFHFQGDRDQVRRQTVVAALTMLLESVDMDADTPLV